MKTKTKAPSAPISKEWFNALNIDVQWVNYQKDETFPIKIRFTFDTMLPEKRYGKNGEKLYRQPITPLSKERKAVVRDKIKLWEKEVGEYFQFEEIKALDPTDFLIKDAQIGKYEIRKTALNTLHIFHHGRNENYGKNQKKAPTGNTEVIAGGDFKVRFATIGLAIDIDDDRAFFENIVTHELGHLWLKHPVKNAGRDNERPPFISREKISPFCNETVMIYRDDCKPVRECLAPLSRTDSTTHCTQLLPKQPLPYDVATVKERYSKPSLRNVGETTRNTPKPHQNRGELGQDKIKAGGVASLATSAVAGMQQAVNVSGSVTTQAETIFPGTTAMLVAGSASVLVVCVLMSQLMEAANKKEDSGQKRKTLEKELQRGAIAGQKSEQIARQREMRKQFHK